MGRQGWGGGGVSERVPPRGRDPCAAGCGWRILMAGVFACKRLGTVSVVIKLVGGGGGGVWARGRVVFSFRCVLPVSVKTGGADRENSRLVPCLPLPLPHSFPWTLAGPLLFPHPFHSPLPCPPPGSHFSLGLVAPKPFSSFSLSLCLFVHPPACQPRAGPLLSRVE